MVDTNCQHQPVSCFRHGQCTEGLCLLSQSLVSSLVSLASMKKTAIRHSFGYQDAIDSPRPNWDLRKIDLAPSLQTHCQPAFCLWKYLILSWISLLRGLKSMIAHALIKGHRSDRLWRYLIYSFSFRAADHCFVSQYFFWALPLVPWLTPFTWQTQSSDETLWECSSSAPALFSLPLFSFLPSSWLNKPESEQTHWFGNGQTFCQSLSLFTPFALFSPLSKCPRPCCRLSAVAPSV